MRHTRRAIFAGLGALLLALLNVSPVDAGYVSVNSRVALGGTDFIDWGDAGANFATITNPFAINSNLGETANVSQVGNSSFLRLNQSNGWSGNFAPGDELIWTFGTNGPMTIMFGTDLSAAGAQIQQNQFGAFVAVVDALDAGGNVLATFNFNGNSTSAGDNSAIFVGIAGTLGSTFRGLRLNVNTRDIGINQFDFTTAVPVPGGIILALTGIPVGFLMARARRKNKVTESIA